jgi:superfamily II DNA helicase RecQ
MGVKLTIIGWRHASKAIYRKYINDKAVIKAVVEGDEDEDEEDNPFDIQTGHGSRIGGGIYGRPITESPFSTESQRTALRRVSIEWHRWLLFKSALEVQPKKGSRAAEARREAMEEEFRRWRRMRVVNIQEQLEALVGEGAKFRDVQERAIQAIMRQKSPVVVVMGTGAGKSMLFILPASCSTGVTVVVVPLVSLRGNLMDRCDKAGIECVEWDSRKPLKWASVVLVMPESAVSEGFGNFINRQRAMGRLDRIVIDKCHVVLDSTKGWRTRMLGLRDLVKTETQLVYLTATMRPRDEAEFIRLMGLPAKEKCHWFRGVTTRKNVEYQIRLYNREEEEEVVKKLVEEKKRQYSMPGQIIVYCGEVEKTVKLARVLGYVCYHCTVGSRTEKSELVRQLTEGI